MESCSFRWNDIVVTVRYTGVVNYALQLNRRPLIRELRLEHRGGQRAPGSFDASGPVPPERDDAGPRASEPEEQSTTEGGQAVEVENPPGESRRELETAPVERDTSTPDEPDASSQAPRPIEDLRISVSADSHAPASPPEEDTSDGSWTTHLARLPPGEDWSAQDLVIQLPAEELAALDERRPTRLTLRLDAPDRQPVDFQIPVDLYAYNEWHGIGLHPEGLAAFCLPNHPDLVELVSTMRDILTRWSGDDSLSGYQRRDPGRVRTVVASAYGALKELGFSYVNPPASFEQRGQKVRTVEQLLHGRMGTCLDLSLLMAACLEHVGLHPMIVVIRGHAFCGLWLDELVAPDTVLEDPAYLRKQAKLGRALFFDPSLAVSAEGMSFDDAEGAALDHLANLGQFIAAVDVASARLDGIRPIPSRVIGDDGRVRLIDHDHREGETRAVLPSEGIDRRALEERARRHLEQVAERTDEDPIQRLERWRSRLLDLSLRNTLLNLKHTRSTAFLLHHDLAALEDALATGDAFDLHPKPDSVGSLAPMSDEIFEVFDRPELRSRLEMGLDNRRLHSTYPSGELADRLLFIYRRARRAIEESGVNHLHVALGFLRWFDPGSPGQVRRAPLVLLPATLERTGATDRFRLRLTDDEALANPSLVEKLRQEFSIEVEGLSVLPEDASGLDLQLIFKQFREAVLERKGWDLLEVGCLGTFAFGKFLMWHDLSEHEARLRENPVVRRILDPMGEVLGQSARREAPDSDTRHDLCILEADSSQVEAVRAAAAGESFVLQGPPGTGKSQTIANIIGQSLAAGKRVLFVAEKRAALEVVYERIREVGLDDFCLELHSDNANRRAVAAQLGRALQQASPPSTNGWPERIAELEEAREPVNAYVQAIHRTRDLGKSVYEVVNRLTELDEAPEVPVDLGDDADLLTADRWQEIHEEVALLRRSTSRVAPVAEHPLHDIRVRLLDPARARLAEEVIAEYRAALEEARRCLNQLPDDVPPPTACHPAALEDHARRIGHLMARPPGGRTLAEISEWGLVAPRLESAIDEGLRREQFREELADRYTEALYELDLEAERRRFARWTGTFFLLAWLMLWWARRRLRAATPDGQLPENERIVEDLEAALTAGEIGGELDDGPSPGGLGPPLWQGRETDWNVLATALGWAKKLREDLRELSSEGRTRWRAVAVQEFVPWTEEAEAIQAYRQAVEQLEKSHRRTMELLKVEGGQPAREEREDWLDAASRRAARWQAGLEEARPWSLYLRVREKVGELGLAPIIAALETGRLDLDAVEEAAERAVLRWWAERVFAAEDQLRLFDGLDHAETIRRFRSLDRQSFEWARSLIRARLAAEVPEPEALSRDGEVGILLREIQKKSRHLPIRRLFDRISNLLPRLTPCMLMSPMSVAQYLTEDPVDFDLVLFDEASQIPPWDALGAISRAEQVVVVGDSKQLPPTTFFEKAYEDEVIVEVEDLESILDESVAAGLPSRRLRWHYRSRDESLIAFSNARYYDGDLLTFPSPHHDRPGLGVSYRHVPDAYYDRGGTRTNEGEARAIVEDVVRRLTDPDEVRRSIGIIAFSRAQQTCIEDMLDGARREVPEIEPYFGETVDEPVFVKNIETVQGDERDVMLFSVGYAPDEAGRMTMNFGPLNRKGGERRLNVAITRAREELILFARLEPEQIDLSRTSARAVAHLKALLEYARRGPSAVVTSGAGSTEDAAPAIARRIARRLEQAGHDARCGVGRSGCRLDVAVIHPEHPEAFCLGVALDERSHRLGRTARDRERTIPNVLDGLGWEVERVWSADWWYDADRQLRTLVERADEQASEPPPKLETRTNDLVVVESEDETSFIDGRVDDEQVAWVDSLLSGDVDYRDLDNAIPYERQELEEDARTQDAFDHVASLPAIARSVRDIVEVEGPVHASDIFRRVAHHWSYSVLSSRIEDRIRGSLEHLPEDERPVHRDGFLWPPSLDPTTYRTYRPVPPSDERPRDSSEIAPEEAANAAYALLERTLSLGREEACRKIAEIFGYSRLGSRNRKLGEAALDLLLQQGRAEVDDDRIRLASNEPTKAGEQQKRQETTS